MEKKSLPRIALSLLLALALLAPSASCADPDPAPSAAAVDGAPADGIGTSPSDPIPPPLVEPAFLLGSPLPARAMLRQPTISAIPILAPVAGFLLGTDEGRGILLGIGVWLWRKLQRDERKRRSLGQVVSEAFSAAEAIGITKGLDGHGKYKEFVQMVVDAMKAEGHELTGQEFSQLEQMAKRKAWIGKLPAPPIPVQ